MSPRVHAAKNVHSVYTTPVQIRRGEVGCPEVEGSLRTLESFCGLKFTIGLMTV